MNNFKPNKCQSNEINRRKFIGPAVAASIVLPSFNSEEAFVRDPFSSTHLTESKKKVPIIDDADVIVCGGGPAGIAAAITAARAGASVRLFEKHGCLLKTEKQEPGKEGLSTFNSFIAVMGEIGNDAPIVLL